MRSTGHLDPICPSGEMIAPKPYSKVKVDSDKLSGSALRSASTALRSSGAIVKPHGLFVKILFIFGLCIPFYAGLPAPAAAEDFDATVYADSLPEPRSVMTRSLLIPGWGQITNRQPLKVPVIYASYSAAAVYTSFLTQRYHDYRAATYNVSRGLDSDFRFGATPTYIPPNADVNQLRQLRDQYRNRRDLMVLIFGVLHGLNALDAYVFAHMKSFDVSDKLSMNVELFPLPNAASRIGDTSLDFYTPTPASGIIPLEARVSDHTRFVLRIDF